MWKLLSSKKESNSTNINIGTSEIELRETNLLERIDEKFKEQKQDFKEISDNIIANLDTSKKDISKHTADIIKLEQKADFQKQTYDKAVERIEKNMEKLEEKVDKLEKDK